MEHLYLNSIDGAQLNLDTLYKIAPSAFTETLNTNTGKIGRKMNFDVLRRLLGDIAVDDSEGEMYQFTWLGKSKARAEAAKPIDKTLHPIPEDSVLIDFFIFLLCVGVQSESVGVIACVLELAARLRTLYLPAGGQHRPYADIF